MISAGNAVLEEKAYFGGGSAIYTAVVVGMAISSGYSFWKSLDKASDSAQDMIDANKAEQEAIDAMMRGEPFCPPDTASAKQQLVKDVGEVIVNGSTLPGTFGGGPLSDPTPVTD